MDALAFALKTLGLGVLCSVPGIVAGRYLASREIVRETPIWLLVGSVCILFILRLSFPQARLEMLVGIVVVLVPLGMYRQDLWTYFREGRRSR